MAKTKKRLKRPTKSAVNRYKFSIKRRRPVHKKILLHPSTIIVLIIFGGWLVFSSIRVSAANFQVTATVPAPALSEPATITQPIDQSKFTSQPITVSGTCPTPAYVEIYDNGGFSGVVNCNSDGTFSLQTGLVSGSNVLSAEVFNITDMQGPTSPNVTVYYNPPAQSSTSTTTTQPKSTIKTIPLTTTQAFVLRSTYKYQIYAVNELIQIPLTIIGGNEPYALTITWGDSQISTVVRSNSGLFQLSHSYSQANGLQYYQIRVQAIDSAGQTAYIQLLTVVRGKAVVVAATTTKKPTFLATVQHWLWLIWVLYLIIILMIISYWLGEREEYRKLKRRSYRTF
jgi:hypothetical protein